MRWDEVKEIAPLYVIGALDEKLARDLESSLHSATLDERRVVARWRDVAALLPHALRLETPPERLKEQLLKRIVEEAQQTPIEIAVEESIFKGIAEQDDKKVLPFIQPRRAESRAGLWVLTAAAALFAFTAGYLFIQNTKLDHKLDALAH